MLTFLRKIRKSLIGSGSAKKYILYAVGEVLLVMIGILLALQVNNWNENQKRKQLEFNLVGGLLEEMQINREIVTESKERHEDHLKSIENILFDDTISFQLKLRDFWRQLNFRSSDFQSGTFQSIVSEQGLSIISNMRLKKFIASWEDKKADIVENEAREWQLVHERIYPLYSDKIRMLDFMRSPNDGSTNPMEDNSKSESKIRDMINDQSYQGLLIQRRRNERIVIREIGGLISDLDSMIIQAQSILYQ